MNDRPRAAHGSRPTVAGVFDVPVHADWLFWWAVFLIGIGGVQALRAGTLALWELVLAFIVFVAIPGRLRTLIRREQARRRGG